MDLVCIGELLVDFTPGDGPAAFVANPGGAPANVAVAAARNGLEAGFCGMVGDDAFGRMLLSALEGEGVSLLCPPPTPLATTTMAFVSLDGRGEREFTFARKPGADMMLGTSDIPEQAIASARMVHAGSCSLSGQPSREATLHALKFAREHGVMTAFDVNYRQSMWPEGPLSCAAAVREALPLIDLLKVSEDDLAVFGGLAPLLVESFESGVRIVVETVGEGGARLFPRSGEPLDDPGFPAEAVDTTGAGDAFWGAFLSHLLLASPDGPVRLGPTILSGALLRGNAAGSLSVLKSGAIPSLPSRDEVISFLRSNGEL